MLHTVGMTDEVEVALAVLARGLDVEVAGADDAVYTGSALMALAVANRGYVLQTGQIVLHDNARALLANETVRKAYLGEE